MKPPWSIASLLRKEEREWVNSNDLRRRLRYGWFAREIVKAGERPFRYASMLLFLLVLLIILSWLLPETWLVGRWSSWSSAEQLTYFTSLWAIQSTVVALVYPFILAFVALFLARRPSSKALLQIYLVDSGGLAAGLSSVFLVLAMSIQYVLLSIYSLTTAMTWVAVDSIWFIYNVVLTGWFLFRTVEFLHSDFQMQVVRRFAANVALPREVANLLRFQFFVSSQKKGWIPGPEYLDVASEGQPRVLMRVFGDRMGEVSVRRCLREQCRLTNVFFWPLRLVVQKWLRKARKVQPVKVPDVPNRLKYPSLVLPVVPGGIYESDVVLARVDSYPKLSVWQSVLVWMTFRFRPLRLEYRQVTPNEILADLETDARVAAGNGDVSGFELAYGRVTELHKTLLGASLAKADDGKLGSWALIPDIFKFPDRPLHEQWASSYRSLFDAAVNLLPREFRPLRRLCYVVQHLMGPDLQQCPIEIRQRILSIPTELTYLLGTWWSQRIEEQGVLKHGANEMALLRPPLQGAYEEAWLNFVGAWDSTRRAVAKFSDNDRQFEWVNGKELLKINIAHINHTCLMLLRSVARGDRAAAEWLADFLSKWGGDATVYETGATLLYEKANFISSQVLNQEWSAVVKSLGVDENEARFRRTDKSLVQKYVYQTALGNYWRDVRMLTVEILLSWAIAGQSEPSERSLAVYIALGFLKGQEWRSGGRVKEPLNQLTASKYLTMKARQYGADSSYREGYLAQLDSFVESAKDILRPDMVPGRLYSYTGADDVESLKDAQLIIFIVLSGADWRPDESLRRQLSIWAYSSFQSTEFLKQRAEAMRQRLNEIQDGFYPKLIEPLIAQTGKTHAVSEGVVRTRTALDALLGEIGSLQSEAVASAEVSPERLQEIEDAASKEGFSKETGQFPLQLFSSIVYGDEPQEPFVFVISNLRKGEFTEIEMAQRAVNESEWYSRAVAEGVGQTLLEDIIRQGEIKDAVAPDANAYWEVLKAEAKKLQELGLTPLVILDNPTRPDWVWEWQHPDRDSPYPRPPDLILRHEEEERGDGYLDDFNGIQFFSGPVSAGESVLLAREAFSNVAFRMYRTNTFIKAEVSEVAGSRTLINLRLTFERRVKIGHKQIVRIRYATDAENDATIQEPT